MVKRDVETPSQHLGFRRDEEKNDTVTIGVQRPMDLESMLLNFTILTLLVINGLGWELFWKK